MTHRWRRCIKWALASSLAMGGTLASSGEGTKAQIKPDTTLPHNSIVTPQGSTSQIDGGTRAGNNLFHSFSQFSVPTGGTAFFNNALDVKSIISRVTGGSISNIDGILKANGTANLFLLNPNGIIFGPNAQLNIGGSFVGTTSNALGFGNQGTFSASTPNNPALLTVNPSALLFNQIAAQPITINSARFLGVDITTGNPIYEGLKVPNGNSLLFVGGDVKLDGGILQAPGGRIEVGGLTAPGNIGLVTDSNNPGLIILSFPVGVERADVSLVNTAYLSVLAGNGGSIAINARNLSVLGGSVVLAGIAPNSGSLGAKAGDITIDATGVISVDNTSFIINQVSSQGIGNAGNVEISTRTLSVTNGSQIDAVTAGQGNAGNVRITATDRINFDGVDSYGSPSVTSSSIEPGGVGNGGNVEIKTGTLSVTNGSQIQAGIFEEAKGNGGNLKITADFINFDGVGSGAGTSINPGGVGNAGNIEISAGTISIANRAQINADTLGMGNAGNIEIGTNSLNVTHGAEINSATFKQGNAGNVRITAKSINLDGVGSNRGSSIVTSSVNWGAVGHGGNVEINTDTLSVTNGSQIGAAIKGQGNGGNIKITADSINFDGEGSNGKSSLAGSSVNPRGVGNAGNVEINTGTLSVTHGAQINALTYGRGNAGSVTINARDSINFDGVGSDGSPSSAGSSVEPGAVGNGGNLNITTRNLSLTNGAGVTTSSNGLGDAGDILNIIADKLTLDKGVIFTVSPSGNGGNIRNIQVQNLLLLRNQSQISTTAGTQQSGGGNGGNINITASSIVAVPSENSDITANAFAGRGGNIQISTQGIFGITSQKIPTSQSYITASSQLGVNGTIQITTPGVDPSRGLVPPPVAPAAPNVAQVCQASSRQGGSRFINGGRGGLPANPSEALSSSTLWSDPRVPVGGAENFSIYQNSPQKSIEEATGWIKGPNRTVILISQTPTATTSSSESISDGCHAP